MSELTEDIRILPQGGKATRCIHHNGTTNDRCLAGVRYADVAVDHAPIKYRHERHGSQGSPYSLSRSLPCMGKYNLGGATCVKLELLSAEEIAADEAAHQRTMDLMRLGLSSCCEAPIDESQVIRSGRHKGHGPRFCSKCRRCVFMV